VSDTTGDVIASVQFHKNRTPTHSVAPHR
jgi:hypothetical protein